MSEEKNFPDASQLLAGPLFLSIMQTSYESSLLSTFLFQALSVQNYRSHLVNNLKENKTHSLKRSRNCNQPLKEGVKSGMSNRWQWQLIFQPIILPYGVYATNFHAENKTGINQYVIIYYLNGMVRTGIFVSVQEPKVSGSSKTRYSCKLMANLLIDIAGIPKKRVILYMGGIHSLATQIRLKKEILMGIFQGI